MDFNLWYILTILSIALLLVPIISWLDTFFAIPLMVLLPILYLYYLTNGDQAFSFSNRPIYILFVWLSIPLGFISGILFEIFLIPSYFLGSIGAIYSFS